VTQDTIGDGYLRPSDGDDEFVVDEGMGILDLGLIENYTGDYSLFDRIRNREGTYDADADHHGPARLLPRPPADGARGDDAR